MPANNLRFVRRFRTYPAPKNIGVQPDCKIWQAIRATMAAPCLFKAIEIPSTGEIPECFADGGLGCNNPSLEVVREAAQLFGDNCTVSVFLSIGAGHPGIIKLPKSADVWQKLIQALDGIATDCERIADDLKHRCSSIPDIYFRLNILHGAAMVPHDEWSKSGEMLTHTRAYLQADDVSRNIDLIAKHLCNVPPSSITLAAMGK